METIRTTPDLLRVGDRVLVPAGTQLHIGYGSWDDDTRRYEHPVLEADEVMTVRYATSCSHSTMNGGGYDYTLTRDGDPEGSVHMRSTIRNPHVLKVVA